MKKSDRRIVEMYDYFQSMFSSVLKLFPPFLRNIVYKCMFNHFGKNIYIGPKCFLGFLGKSKLVQIRVSVEGAKSIRASKANRVLWLLDPMY